MFSKFVGQFDLKGQCQGHKFLEQSKMTNTQLKEKFPGSKVVAFTKNNTKLLSFRANLTLKVKVKVTSFQTRLKHLDA